MTDRYVILFFSDLHWAGPQTPVFPELLNWVRDVSTARNPDLVIFGGDMIQRNDPAAFASLWRNVSWIARRQAFYWLPGNRDFRVHALLESRRMARAAIRGALCFERAKVRLILLNSEDPAAIRRDIGAWSRPRPCPATVVFSHREHGAQDRLASWMAGEPTPGSTRWFVYGHTHEARDARSDGWRTIATAGLDASRIIGPHPDALQITLQQGKLACERLAVPNRHLWLERRRRVVPGIAPQAPIAAVFATALRQKITAIQLSPACLATAAGKSEAKLAARWRQRTAQPFLSFHLPDPDLDSPAPLGGLERHLIRGQALGINDYTIHPPCVPANAFFDSARRPAGAIAGPILELYARLARKAIALGATLNIENMHNVREHISGHIPDLLSTRPWHMAALISALRERLMAMGHPAAEADRIGMNFDAGHARNNGAVQQQIAPSEWIGLLGAFIRTLHLHQVIQTADGLKNHQPITTLAGPLLNYAGLLAILAATPGPDCHAFVEVRRLEDAAASWQTIMRLKERLM